MPLFTSYVFVYLNSWNDYFSALQVPGACYFISFEGKAARVLDKEIEQLKLLLGTCENVELVSRNIKCGQIVKISRGPFAGFTCEVVKFNGKNKILVRIDSLLQNVVAELQPVHFEMLQE